MPNTCRYSIKLRLAVGSSRPSAISSPVSYISASMLATMKTTSLSLLALTTAASAYQTCVVPFGGSGVDDSDAVRALLPNCSSDAEIVFASCTTYNISTPLDFGTLSNVTITILGDLNLPESIPYVQSLVNATAGQRLSWFTIAVCWQ